MNAQSYISHGNRFPFDASNDWWHQTGNEKPPKSKDWAHSAARGVIANLQDRQGIKFELVCEKIDEDLRVEIIESLAAIIRKAAGKP